MAGKPISKQSLQNLAHCNQESRRLTREAIEIALLSLLEKKPLGHITISELVARAGVSRNAFYRNYSSKEDILECLLTSVIRRIFRGLKAFDLKTQAYQAWLYLFTEAKKEAALLNIIFNHHLQQLLTQMVTKRLRAYQKWQEKSCLITHCSFGATLSSQSSPIGFLMIWLFLLRRWLLWGCPY